MCVLSIDVPDLHAAQRAAVVVCGWGESGGFGGREQVVLRMLRGAGVKPYALHIKRDGTPKHPLFVKYATVPVKIP